MLKRTLLSAVALFIAATNVAAAEELHCANYNLLMTNARIAFIGDAEAGAKVGDRRILNWRIHRPEGPDLGQFHVVTTVLKEEADGHLITAVGSADLANGEIHASTTAWLPNAADEEQSSSAAVHWAILGGTGEFSHAKGTLLTEPPGSDSKSLSDWTFDLKMHCDR